MDTTSVADLPAYINDNGLGTVPPDNGFESTASAKLYKLNSGTNKTGLGMTLRVMKGDQLDIFGKSYWVDPNAGGPGANSAIPVLELLTGLVGSLGGVLASTGHGGTTASDLNGLSATTGSITSMINTNRDDPPVGTIPKAYINCLFFDDQFKCVDAHFSMVSADDKTLKSHIDELQGLVAPANGYVYIYVSNESPVNVFFDNLQVVHKRSRLVEETHYYAFGFTMATINDKVLISGNPENKYKSNEKIEQ